MQQAAPRAVAPSEQCRLAGVGSILRGCAGTMCCWGGVVAILTAVAEGASLPLPSGRGAISGRSTESCAPLLLHSGSFSGGADADRPEWRPIVYSWSPLPVLYRVSPFFYSVSGAAMIYEQETLSVCDPWFPWASFGAALMVQGPVSYMADVWAWGRPSIWKTIDGASCVRSSVHIAAVLRLEAVCPAAAAQVCLHRPSQ
eukprot:SAG31_NODE_4256_length_3414_cov_2.193665_3_plen_200_part_00